MERDGYKFVAYFLYMQSIITPTDFSQASLNAVNYAADMALALNTRLVVLHATGTPGNSGDIYTAPAHDEIDEKLNSLKNDLIKRTNKKIPVHTKKTIGFTESEIISACRHQKPLAVIMATRGASFMEHFFKGSITVYLSKNLKYPVIVVPHGLEHKPIRKILLATDLENISGLPIERIKNIVKVFNAQLDVVHVSNGEDKPEITSRRMNELTGYLSGCNAHGHFIYNRNVYEGIIDFAKENNADIILTFPKKHSFFYKSKSKQLIFKAPFAVMTLQ